jgi:hypothetical protein
MDDIICPWCGKEFMVNVDYSYTYSTVKIGPDETIQG